MVTAEPPSSVTAGAGFGLTVTAEDSDGNVDSSFNGTVSVALYNNPGGALGDGDTLTVTAQSGVAVFSGLTLAFAATGYTLLVSGSGETGATTTAFNVTPAAVAQLFVTTQPPVGVVAGSGFGLVVLAKDQFGNVASNFAGSVAVALHTNPVGAKLGGTVAVTAQSGVATFSGLTLDQPGTGYSLEASAIGPAPAVTSLFNVYVPTVYTVDLTSTNGTGSGNAGDLVYALGLANANTNIAGSVIEFDPSVFNSSSPQTITLGGTRVLSETAGPR